MRSRDHYPERTAQVSYTIFTQAYKNWQTFHNTSNNDTWVFGDSGYDAFMGMKMRTSEWADEHGGPVAVTPEAANKMTQLAGPHWYALLKAYEAQEVT